MSTPSTDLSADPWPERSAVRAQAERLLQEALLHTEAGKPGVEYFKLRLDNGGNQLSRHQGPRR